MKLVMFSKHLAPLSIEEAARRAGELGFDGLDLTVRPGGHIEPPDALEALPRAVDLVRGMGYDIPMITTGITSADDPHADDIFQAAGESGIRDLKLGYWPYRGFGNMRRQIEEARELLDGIAPLAEKHGVRANLHSHSGNFLTADAAVVWQLLLGRDPDVVGAYIDPGHMTVEGGVAGWKMGMDLLTPWINLVAIKSMAWVHQYDEEMGQEKWQTKLVPLPEGLVPWREFFGYLHDIGYDGTISLHSEYQGPHSWRDLSLEELLAQTKEDLAFIKQVIADTFHQE
ncbi:MAG: sugar phosphate isomerase/epimerase [Anaerolineae bacterium]|nr:sugar phosphate isomerase/epimerase [Anaerolineae bacterium]